MATSSFAALLRGHRLALGLTQEELAERAGLSGRAISDLERGLKQAPRPSTVRLLVQALGLGTADAARLVAGAQGHHQARLPPGVEPAPGHLPRQLNSFVGRQQELAELRRLLPTTPLLTLVGPGGVGKTRLALRLAADVLDASEGPVTLVELAGLADAERVPETVCSAVGLREQPGRAPTAALIDALRQRQLLLLLDNCEHLVDACAALVAALLAECRGLRILTTSREALRIAGETTWRVPPLGLPPLPAGSSPATSPLASSLREQIEAAEAVQLFVARAAAALPGFALTDRNAPTVAHICQQLDGLPLAIELAAARITALSVAQLGQRLDDRFRLLTSGNRTALPRQQTLRAALDWSHDLLQEPERVLFRRLGTFAGGWTLEAAEAVCAGHGVTSAEVLARLCALVDQSLVTAEECDGAARYRLLETVRQYAVERLVASGQDLATREQHAAYFLGLAESAQPHLRGPLQAEWLARLDPEHDNLRAALRWCLEQGDEESAVRFGAALWRYWQLRGHITEGRERLTEVLGLAGTRGPGSSHAAWQASVLTGAGHLAHLQGDTTGAQRLCEQSLALHRQLGDRAGIAGCLNSLGNLARARGQYQEARSLYRASMAITQEIGDRRGIAVVLNNLGEVAQYERDGAAAWSLYTEGLAIGRELGDPWCMANSIQGLADVAQQQGDYAAARPLYEQSLALNMAIQDRGGIAARLEGFAGLAAAGGQAARALRLAGAAARLRASVGMSRQPPEDELFRLWVQPAEQALTQAAAAAAWAEGQAMSDQQVVAYALQADPEAGPSLPDAPPDHGG